MLYLPFNHPEACVKVVKQYADNPSVIGFTITSTRFRPIHHDSYMRLYAAIQATGKPLSFHSGFQLGRSVDCSSSTASSRCMRSRSCTLILVH